MRHPHAPHSELVGAARGRYRTLVTLSLSLFAPLAGCAPGVAELFLNDVKNFYLNGGLAPGSGEEMSSSEEEGGEAAPQALERTAEEGTTSPRSPASSGQQVRDPQP